MHQYKQQHAMATNLQQRQKFKNSKISKKIIIIININLPPFFNGSFLTPCSNNAAMISSKSYHAAEYNDVQPKNKQRLNEINTIISIQQ
jgi:hypothetical protein